MKNEELATKKDIKNLELATKKDIKNLELATKKDIQDLAQSTKREIQDLTNLIRDFIDMANERFDPLETRVTKHNAQFDKLLERLDNIRLRQQDDGARITHVEKFLTRKRYLPQLKPAVNQKA